MNKFERDLTKAKKQHRDIVLLKEIMITLVNEKPLEAKQLYHPFKALGREQENVMKRLAIDL